MAWSNRIGSITGAASKLSGTTLVWSPVITLVAGDVVIVALGVDNDDTADGQTSSVTGVTDGLGNAYNLAGEFTNGNGAAQAGACTSVWWCKIVTGGAPTFTVTISQDGYARCGQVCVFSVAAGSTVTVDGIQTAADDGADPASLTCTPASGSREYLFIHSIAHEGDTGDTWTVDANFTGFQAAEQGTTGGGAAGNMCVAASYRILTASSSTANDAWTARDHAQVLIAFKETLATKAPPIWRKANKFWPRRVAA